MLKTVSDIVVKVSCTVQVVLSPIREINGFVGLCHVNREIVLFETNIKTNQIIQRKLQCVVVVYSGKGREIQKLISLRSPEDNLSHVDKVDDMEVETESFVGK